MAILAEWLMKPITIWGFVSCLILWATVSGIFFRRKAQRLLRYTTQARREIEEVPDAAAFSASFEIISEKLQAIPVYGQLWADYRETLITPDVPGRPVQTTQRPDEWFDLGLLHAPGIRVNMRYHTMLPNLLVGAGLLLTFLGLTAALDSAGRVVAEGISQAERNQSLHDLLNAASFKFITSIAGLFLSIIYSIYVKYIINKTERYIGKFCTALQSRLPLVGPPQLQTDGNRLLQSLSGHMESFSTQLAANIGDVFDRAFDQRLGEHIAPLTEAMQTLAKQVSIRTDESMEKMLTTFLERLQGSSTARVEEALKGLNGLGSQLEAMTGGLDAASRRMAEAADTMAHRMGEGAEAALSRITDQVAVLSQTLRELAEQTRSAGAGAVEALAGRIAEVASRIDEALSRAAQETGSALGLGAEQAVGRIAAATEGMREELQEVLAELRETMAQAGKSVQAAGDQGGRALQAHLDAAADALVAQMAGATEGLRSAGNETGQRLQEAADALASRTLSLADRGLELTRGLQTLSENIETLQETTAAAAAPLAASAADLRQAGEAAATAGRTMAASADGSRQAIEQLRATGQSLGEVQDGIGRLLATMERTSHSFEAVDQGLAGVIGSLQDGLARLTQQIKETVIATDKNLASAASQIGSAVRDLEGIIEDLHDSNGRKR